MAIVYSQTENSRRIKALVTITAGVPIPFLSGNEPIRLDRVFVQMLAGGSGAGKVYDDVPPNTAAGAIAATCGPPVQLAPAAGDGITPGGSYQDIAEVNGFIDGRTIAVDGTNTGDTVLIDAHRKI